MSDLIVIAKPKTQAVPELRIVVKPKAGNPVVRKDDDMIDDSMPSCPRCQKCDDVMALEFHPNMPSGRGAAGTVGDDSPDGYCCAKCKFAWPGDSSTPSQTPARPTEVASIPSDSGAVPATIPSSTPAPADKPAA